MSHIRLAVLVVSLIAPVAAQGADGGVHLYLQPLPPEASRLTFAIASISAVAGDGSESPLKLSLSVVRPADGSRQRLLASGRLPIGSYVGFTVRVKQARLRSDRQDAALAVADTPGRIDFPFVVSAARAPVVWLTLKYEASMAGGVTFSPAFSAVSPPKPIADHAGFVSNSGSNTITVFDRNLAQAVAVIDTCAGPAGMALDPRRRRLYVACAKDDEVQEIDVATGEIIERTRVSPGDRPREVALTQDGLTLIAVNGGSNSISFFDAMSLVRRERIDVGSGPSSVAIDPEGRRAFVFNTMSSSISVIDIEGRSLAATLSTEAAPLRAQFNRRGDRLYVIHERSPYMTVLDARQLTTVTRARLRIGVSAIAVDTVRDLVCIGGDRDTTIEFYDPNALMPLFSMKARAGVSFLAFEPEDSALYMVSPQTRSIAIARLADRKVVSEIDVGDAPYSVAVMGVK
ncbi:MAG: beta-propeller repeat protein [Bacteroidetes bacterium]|nr:beta-propeller repeat protein [Bacteroidota bacterium]